MSTKLTPQAAGLGLTPTVNSNPDATGVYIVPSEAGARYYHVRWANTGGSSVTVTLDDPTSASPVSAAAFNPDVSLAVPNAAQRSQVIDSYRFVDPTTGRINWTFSAALTGSVEITAII